MKERTKKRILLTLGAIGIILALIGISLLLYKILKGL